MKESRKQIVEQTRNKVALQYKAEIAAIQAREKDLAKDYSTLRAEFLKIKEENEELKIKILEYEDWNRRLLEYLDLPTEAKEKVAQKFREERAVSEAYKRLLESPLFKMYESMLSNIFTP